MYGNVYDVGGVNFCSNDVVGLVTDIAYGGGFVLMWCWRCLCYCCTDVTVFYIIVDETGLFCDDDAGGVTAVLAVAVVVVV